jgi:hypothetical protein
MKKFYIALLMLVAISTQLFCTPIYINVKIGFKAKWQITFGECEDGKGICLSRPEPILDNTKLGFDPFYKNKLILRVSGSSDVAHSLKTGSLEVQEDSPVDPSLIIQLSNFTNPNNKIVIIKRGKYPVKTDGKYYTVLLDYVLK